MTTATNTNWLKYDGLACLRPGDKIKVNPFVRLRGGVPNLGTIIRQRRTNFVADFSGRQFNIPPRYIDQYQLGDGQMPQAVAERQVSVQTSAARLSQECKVGDIALLKRGNKFNVVKIIELPNGRLTRLRAMDLGNGTVYKWQAEWYVQKLDASCFA